MNKVSKKMSALFFGLLASVATFAQEEGAKATLDINVNNDGGAFYTQIWFWVVVGLVFILLLVALMRGNSNKN